MNIENMFAYIKGISSEIAVNIENTAKSLVGLEKNSSVSWKGTIHHITPIFSGAAQVIAQIPEKTYNAAIKIKELDPLTNAVKILKKAGDWSLLAAKNITKVETWSKAKDIFINSLFNPFIKQARDKFSLISAAHIAFRNSTSYQKLMSHIGHSVQAEVTDSNLFGLSRGERIIRLFHVSGQTFATESVSRNATVAAAIDYHVKQKKYLEQNRHRIASADSLIEYHQKALENAENKLEGHLDSQNKSWIDSNYFRRLLKQHPGLTFEGVARQFVSAPVNMRYHSVELEGSDRKAGFFRLGIITDPTNGWTNLKELKEMASGTVEGRNQQLKRLAQITKLAEKSNQKIKQSTDYTAAQLLDIPGTIERRRQILQDQMLQLVVAQIDKNASAIQGLKSGSQFNMVHLSLLNPNKFSISSQGWVHDETNQILDMAEIFKEFRNKELIFDGKGPYVDAEGNIHLPQRDSNWPRQVRLNPIFFNTTVQGHTRNDGIQAEINREAINEIIKVFEQSDSLPQSTSKQFRELREKLQDGKSNYAVAELLGSTMINAKLAFSSGCMSAKDRTGLVAGLIVHNFLSDGVDRLYSSREERFRKKVKARFADKMLDRTGPAARIVMDNTGETILKCSPAIFPKISPLTRGRYAFKQLRMSL